MQTLLTDEERQLLAALVRGLKPRRVLEIGVFEGGSSAIILDALEANGEGHLYSLDPDPKCALPRQQRWMLTVGRSPDDLAKVALGVPFGFDMAFIDGDHAQAAALADIEGVLPYLAHEAYVLCHDAYYREVMAAIDEALIEHPDELVDCGMLSRTPVYLAHLSETYYGLRLLRYRRAEGGQRA